MLLVAGTNGSNSIFYNYFNWRWWWWFVSIFRWLQVVQVAVVVLHQVLLVVLHPHQVKVLLVVH
jgi:hypothetical protein